MGYPVLKLTKLTGLACICILRDSKISVQPCFSHSSTYYDQIKMKDKNYRRACGKSIVEQGRSRVLLSDGPGHGGGDELLADEHVAEHLTDRHVLVCNKSGSFKYLNPLSLKRL